VSRFVHICLDGQIVSQLSIPEHDENMFFAIFYKALKETFKLKAVIHLRLFN